MAGLVDSVLAFLVILICGCMSWASPMSGQHEAYLDDAKQAHLLWTYNETHIEVQLTVQTLGWLTFGISPDGRMDQTDAFVAWVNDTTGLPSIQDGWLESNATAHRTVLKKDFQQDWTLLGGTQTSTETRIHAVRALITCDFRMDRPFTKDTLRIIWSSHAVDPVDLVRLPHHQKRGGKSMLFFSPSYLRVSTVAEGASSAAADGDLHPEDLVLKFEQVIIQNDTTTVTQCRLFQLPKFDKKRHIISTRPMLQTGNEPNVKRMIVFLCKSPVDQKFSPATFDCHAQANAKIMLGVRQNCDTLIAAWAIGGGVFSYPEETGLPLNVDSSGRYVLLEVQYDNPRKSIINDSSGIILSTTKSLRRHDAAFLTAGLLQYDYPLTIPPNLPSFSIQTQCADFCTQSAFPSTGINVFAGLFIAHRRARRMAVRHVRNGKELALLIKDDNPDSQYQEENFLAPTTVVFPGDRLIVECQYSTVGKSTATFGGYGIDDETCLAYMSYYPAVNVTDCGSMINTREFLEVTDYIPVTSSSPSMAVGSILGQEVANSSVLRAYYTNKYDFNADNTKKLLKFYTESDQLGVCLGNGVDSMKTIHSTPFISLPVKPTTCIGRPSIQIPLPITITSSVGASAVQGQAVTIGVKDRASPVQTSAITSRKASLKPGDPASMAAGNVQNGGIKQTVLNMQLFVVPVTIYFSVYAD